MSRQPVALRVPPDDLRVIDQEAQARGLSRTDYMIRAATGTLDGTIGQLARRLLDVEAELARCSEAVFRGQQY